MTFQLGERAYTHFLVKGTVPFRSAFSETFRLLGPSANVNDYRGSAGVSGAIYAYPAATIVGTCGGCADKGPLFHTKGPLSHNPSPLLAPRSGGAPAPDTPAEPL